MGPIVVLVLAAVGAELVAGNKPVPRTLGNFVKLRTTKGKCGGEATLADGQTVKLDGLRKFIRKGKCEWSVSTSDPQTSLEIRCPLFDVPWSSGCKRNRLSLGDATGKVETFCGKGNSHILIDSNRMFASYIHRRRFKAKGIQCLVTATRRNVFSAFINGMVDPNPDASSEKGEAKQPPRQAAAVAEPPARVDPPPWTMCECGVSAPDGLTYPWLASIEISHSVTDEIEAFTIFPFCSGSVLNNQYILTSAQCVTDNNGKAIDANSLQVGLGMRDGQTEFTGEKFSIQQVIVHPDFVPSDLNMDVALLKTTLKLNITKYTPVCLPSDPGESFVDKMATLTGVDHLTGLSVKEARILHPSECTEYSNIDSETLCAEYPEGDWSNCLGDTGGPLTVQKDGNRATQVGITVYGWDCVDLSTKGIYSNVAAAYQWIINNTADAQYCEGGAGTLLL